MREMKPVHRCDRCHKFLRIGEPDEEPALPVVNLTGFGLTARFVDLCPRCERTLRNALARILMLEQKPAEDAPGPPAPADPPPEPDPEPGQEQDTSTAAEWKRKALATEVRIRALTDGDELRIRRLRRSLGIPDGCILAAGTQTAKARSYAMRLEQLEKLILEQLGEE